MFQTQIPIPPHQSTPYFFSIPEKKSGSNCLLFTFIFLFIIILLTFPIIFESQQIDYHDFEYFRSLQDQKQQKQEDYNTRIIKNKGIVKLIKGKAEIIHHEIKLDSIINISRKKIIGQAGTLSISEINPNKSFTIISSDDMGVILEEDFSELFFHIV